MLMTYIELMTRFNVLSTVFQLFQDNDAADEKTKWTAELKGKEKCFITYANSEGLDKL